MSNELQKSTFGAGCFWGVEETFRKLDGVVETAVGYSGGDKEDPTYEDVCSSSTGHAEVVEIQFDPSKIKYEKLLETFFNCHNPTQLNYQGPDHGTQYRSAIFYHTDDQRVAAQQIIEDLQNSDRFEDPIVTEVEAAQPFYKAEEYHQKYVMKKGGGSCHV